MKFENLSLKFVDVLVVLEKLYCRSFRIIHEEQLQFLSMNTVCLIDLLK